MKLPQTLTLLLFSHLITALEYNRNQAAELPGIDRRQTTNCENTATSRSCWGEYGIDTNYYEVIPDTRVTRENTTLAVDGYKRWVLVFNGTLPGPTIEADWGDNIIIHVTNEMQNNGTTIHWHGIRQLNTNEHDGVPGVTQCPIPPGETMTYKFRATQYGTSWYHSHFSLQLADGLQGAIVLHGPATADYDVDLGPLFLTDWGHKTAWVVWDESTKYGGAPLRDNPVLQNGLINGTNTYNCSGIADSNCLGTGRRFETKFETGKRYLIRLIDSSIDGWMKFTIDGHKLTVVANNLVPIVPYTTDNVIMASGQRYDIIVEANQDVGSYWMRAIYQTACNSLDNDNADNILGILRYEGANSAVDPTTTKANTITNSCGDEPYASLVPHLAIDVGNSISEKNLNIGWFYELSTVFHWTINTTPLKLDWANPTNLIISRNGTVFPTLYNVQGAAAANKWTYWVIQDLGLVDVWHPMHLHGHDFFVLAQGSGLFNHLTVPLNLENPPRRDTATLPGNGYLVIAMYSDNPGSWLMHCHIAWHASQGLSLQFVEREAEIPALMLDAAITNETCKSWESFYAVSAHKQDDSGI